MNTEQQLMDRTLEWRAFHARHLERQTSALESIRSMVLVWFCLTLGGLVLSLVAMAFAG